MDKKIIYEPAFLIGYMAGVTRILKDHKDPVVKDVVNKIFTALKDLEIALKINQLK